MVYSYHNIPYHTIPQEDRVQVQLPDGSWLMYSMYESDESLMKKQKKQRQKVTDEARKRAYEDARQWKLITGKYSFDLGIKIKLYIFF